jgi:hypothetical protein
LIVDDLDDLEVDPDDKMPSSLKTPPKIDPNSIVGRVTPLET